MWNPKFATGYEARKCRYRVATLCRGAGLDLNTINEKIVPSAIGICKYHGTKANMTLDLSANNGLSIFSDNQFDYVFDAHQLGDFACTDSILKEWWRVIKQGGYLILYEQDRDFYPLVGTNEANSNRKKDLYWQEAWDVINSFGNAELVSATRHNDSNEYSWQLVVKKKFVITEKPQEILKEKNNDGKVVFPRKKKTDKEALVIRYGALGDTCWVTPVLSQLKKDGYYVVMNVLERGAEVLKENPNIDEFIIHSTSEDVPYEELEEYWNMLSEGFEKTVNLTKSCEGTLVKVEGSSEYYWSKEKRHKECNFNFQDRVMECAGYPEEKGRIPELYFTEHEEYLGKLFMENRKDKFVVLWSLSGSGFHKTYPWSEYVVGEMAMRYKDVEVITVGDESCKILEWQNPITTNKSGVWTVRQSFLISKYANLVIGSDTGLMNAAAAFDTPKIVFLSTNTEENLTKNWKNAYPLHVKEEDCECYPCHRLIYTNCCPKGNIQGIAPRCMENIRPEVVMNVIEELYSTWKKKQQEKFNQKRFAAFTIADSAITHRLAKRTRASFEKFHPDIPFFIYDPVCEQELLGQVRESACACKAFEIRPALMKKLLKEYDGVIYLDADTVVCDRLDEFVADDYDIAGSLNIGSDSKNQYLNAGVSACTSLKFCEEWETLMYKPDAPPSNQVSFNDLAHNGQYKLKIVDEKDVYYNETSREYWKDLTVKDGKLWCNNRLVKVLHWAGGVARMEDKLSSKDFSTIVRIHLNHLTNTTDFVEIEGQEVSKW